MQRVAQIIGRNHHAIAASVYTRAAEGEIVRIAVATPNGNVGRHVLAMLVRAGVRPLALARHPERLPAAIHPEVDVAAVDLLDADAVVQATRGMDALYWVDPSPTGDDPFDEYARATESVVQAVNRNRIGRVVFQSSVGAELRYGAGEIDGLAATEEAIDKTRASVTHLRCGFFFSNLLPQLGPLRAPTLPILLPPDLAMPWVAPRDIAEVAVGRLLHTGWYGRIVQGVHGPGDLSWERAAEIAGFAVERVPDDTMRAMFRTAGMSHARIEALVGMSIGLRDGFTPEQPRSARTTTPTSLAAWLQEQRS